MGKSIKLFGSINVSYQFRDSKMIWRGRASRQPERGEQGIREGVRRPSLGIDHSSSSRTAALDGGSTRWRQESVDGSLSSSGGAAAEAGLDGEHDLAREKKTTWPRSDPLPEGCNRYRFRTRVGLFTGKLITDKSNQTCFGGIRYRRNHVTLQNAEPNTS
jgi:hypothetical protein